MKFWIVVCPHLPATGMAIFPLILIKNASQKDNQVLINHEKIHLQQQLELLILPFYVLYLLNYFINLARYRSANKAYLQIIFEREAYHVERDLQYLKKRRFWGWINFRSRTTL